MTGIPAADRRWPPMPAHAAGEGRRFYRDRRRPRGIEGAASDPASRPGSHEPLPRTPECVERAASGASLRQRASPRRAPRPRRAHSPRCAGRRRDGRGIRVGDDRRAVGLRGGWLHTQHDGRQDGRMGLAFPCAYNFRSPWCRRTERASSALLKLLQVRPKVLKLYDKLRFMTRYATSRGAPQRPRRRDSPAGPRSTVLTVCGTRDPSASQPNPHFRSRGATSPASYGTTVTLWSAELTPSGDAAPADHAREARLAAYLEARPGTGDAGVVAVLLRPRRVVRRRLRRPVLLEERVLLALFGARSGSGAISTPARMEDWAKDRSSVSPTYLGTSGEQVTPMGRMVMAPSWNA